MDRAPRKADPPVNSQVRSARPVKAVSFTATSFGALKRALRTDTFPYALLLLYLLLGGLYAVKTPLWQNPDEPAHYNYVKYIAEERRLPVLQPGDYPACYLRTIVSTGFPDEMSIAPLRYEFYQPPLYYALTALPYRLTAVAPLAQQVLALRLFSLLLSAGVLGFAYATARALFPGDAALAWATAAFPAALPMYVALMAAINNDSLAVLLYSALLYLCVRLVVSGVTTRRLVALGICFGLALLTKATVYVMGLPILVALWMALRDHPHATRLRAFVRSALLVLGLSLLLSGGWFLRNALTYGWHDPLGWQRHTEVVAGQLTTAAYLAEHGWRGWLADFARTSFQSFWGQFGWMAVPMDSRVYLALLLLTLVAGAGLLWFLWSHRRTRALAVAQWQALGLAALSLALMVGLYLWYNRQLVQFQGRYLFAAIVPLGLAFALGWREALRRGHEWGGLAVSGSGAFLGIVKGAATGDWDKWLLALLVVGMVTLAGKRLLPARYGGIFVVLIYLALLALAAAAPFWFIAPYLS